MPQPTSKASKSSVARSRALDRPHDLSEPKQLPFAPAFEEAPHISVVFKRWPVCPESMVPAPRQNRIDPNVFILQSQERMPFAFLVFAAMWPLTGGLHDHLQEHF